ncbi:unnamed protein product [Fraxinus pennsylvanica]|uniref:Uncharacterized protein n=1 Tax=Fraxinus pennsylvanica TaxID=56036 RepID=A0AAD1YV24_9LAMI|nr:unnamed protein product [Fraxinus pennsylvanica]
MGSSLWEVDGLAVVVTGGGSIGGVGGDGRGTMAMWHTVRHTIKDFSLLPSSLRQSRSWRRRSVLQPSVIFGGGWAVADLVIAIGMLFGFGVFKHGFHKLKDTVHDYDPTAVSGGAAYGRRPFLGNCKDEDGEREHEHKESPAPYNQLEMVLLRATVVIYRAGHHNFLCREN